MNSRLPDGVNIEVFDASRPLLTIGQDGVVTFADDLSADDASARAWSILLETARQHNASLPLPWSSDLAAVPKGDTVQAVVAERAARFVISAAYIARHSEPSFDFDKVEEDAEYLADEDTYFLREGWYEVVHSEGPRYIRLPLDPLAWRPIGPLPEWCLP